MIEKYLNLNLKTVIILLCCIVFGACTTPPKRKPSLSAKDLANRELQTQPAAINQPPTNVSIAELPNTPTQSLKQVNQIGKVPTITTITDQTLDVKKLNLSDSDPINLNFEQVELRLILQIITDALGLAVVIDPSIGGKATLRTPPDKPLNKKDLWPLLQLLLSDAGVTMEKRGNVYHLKKAAAKLPNVIGMTPETLITSNSDEILQVTPLRYMAAESAVTVINPLIQPKGRVITLPTLNIIGIITTPPKLARVNNLLRVIDADPFVHRGMRLFRLINSKATDVQTELDKILKALYGKTTPTYQVVALERINAILVIAPPNSGFDDVALWVEILDERSEESGEQIFIYQVKNLEATKLASTLSNVFKEDKTKDKEKNKKKTDKKQPLKLPALTAGKIPVSAELQVNIVADESTNSLLIRASPRDYRQLLETIAALDQVPKEVMVNVVIAEVSLTEATQFGIDWQRLFGFNGNIDIGTNGNRGTVQTNLEVPGGEIEKLSGFSINYLTGSVNALLNIVASNNEISILSRPSLLVRNNEEASINVGSNEPYLSGGSGISQQNTTNVNPYQNYYQDVQYKDTGITVKVTPRINDEGIINLEIESELTLLGPPRTTQNLQSFDQRKIKTFVVVRDKTAIVIGGLIQNNSQNKKQGIPILKDLPILGNLLFSSTNVEDKRTELVLIMVPEIVNPEADNRPIIQEFRQRMSLLSTLLNEKNFYIEGWTQSTLVPTSPTSGAIQQQIPRTGVVQQNVPPSSVKKQKFSYSSKTPYRRSEKLE